MSSSQSKPKRERLSFDALLKDLFQHDQPILLTRIAGGGGVKQTLNVEFAMIKSHLADLLFELRDNSLFLFEIQSSNDGKMEYRVGHYILSASQNFKRKVRAVVLYCGMEPLRMTGRLDAGSAKVNYEVIDIRTIDSETLLSGGPGDWALALLAKGGEKKMREIIAKAKTLERPQRERLLVQLLVLSGLRRLNKKITMEMKQMGAYIDIQKNDFLRGVWSKGITEGIAKGILKGKAEGRVEGELRMLSSLLAKKFGPLPAWATARLGCGTSHKARLWSSKMLTADTLEGVIGRK